MEITNKFINFIKLFNKAFGPYRSKIAILAFLSFLGSILEGVGINSIIPLFSFMSKDKNLGTDAISHVIEKFFNYFNLNYTLESLLIFIVVLFIIKAVVIFINGYITAETNTSYVKNTNNELFKLTLAADWPYLSKQKIGYLDQVLITDISNSSAFLSLVIASILIVANLLIYLLISFNISVTVASFTFLLGAVVIFVFKPFFSKNKILSSQIAKMNKVMAHYINENMLGIKTIKASGVEEEIGNHGGEYFDKVRSLNRRMALVRNLTNSMLQPIGLIFIIIIFAFFYKMTSFNFASFAVIVYAINKVFAYIQLAQVQLHGAGAFIPYVASVVAYREDVCKHTEKIGSGVPFKFENRIEFKKVNFSYNSSREIVSDLNFYIKKGEMVGLIGPSGAGKTTVVDLLLRLFNPTSGEILLDDCTASIISIKDWREHIGYVSQDMFMINDTIENNIKFFNDKMTDEEMVAAAKMANIYEFIQKQPERFSTMVGERGVALSGGEKQRVVLARVLARKPEILVLDEATSALDNESEVLIQKSIEGLKGGVTVLAIAHRLSTVMSADRLIILENGMITEQGKPEELLKERDSYFFKTYNVRS